MPPVRLEHRGYLWQREWNGAVAEGFREASGRLDGVIVLGGEIVWDGPAGAPRLIPASLSWEVLAAARTPVSLGLRIAPFAGVIAGDDANARALLGIARNLLATARAHGVVLAELQLDFDAAQRQLPGYRHWLRAFRAMVTQAEGGSWQATMARPKRPIRFVITTLPSWLRESSFRDLLAEVDGYVLQVHSVPTASEAGRTMLCDPAQARRWVERAAALGRPFSVALPTYRCVAGFDAAGKLLGVAMDAGLPSWPAGTRTLEFASDATALAGLVREWQEARPAGLQEVIWYRLPVASDLRNWRWPTLAAVVAGRTPVARFEVQLEGAETSDVALANVGESDDPVVFEVTLRWREGRLTASDALAGIRLAATASEVVLASPPQGLRLAPGTRRALGWLRLEPHATLEPHLTLHASP